MNWTEASAGTSCAARSSWCLHLAGRGFQARDQAQLVKQAVQLAAATRRVRVTGGPGAQELGAALEREGFQVTVRDDAD